jgi:hypothetical protein
MVKVWRCNENGELEGAKTSDSFFWILATEDIATCYQYIGTSLNEAGCRLVLYATVNLYEGL